MRKANTSAVALQLAAVWMLGALGLPGMAHGLPLLLFAGWGALLIGALVCVALFVTYLWLVISATASVSILGATVPRRGVWVALVLGFGTALWRLAWAVTDEAELAVSTNDFLTVVLGGIPFVLIAGMLLRGRQLRLGIAGATVGLAALGLAVLKHLGPDELTLRLQHANLDRNAAFVVEIPGYRPNDNAYGRRLGTGEFLPDDPSAIPAPRYITVVAYRSAVASDRACGETALDSHLSTADCTAESDGLVYRRAIIEHGYQVRRGDSVVVVAGSLAVDRQLLRDATRTLRPATVTERAALQQPGELFVVDVPGYCAQAMGMPPGVLYKPADHSSGPLSVQITLSAVQASYENVCFRVTCVPESGGLTYVQGEGTHGYVLRNGTVNVHITGGVSVDRALLRQAVLTARPATDAELLCALPPPPTSNPLERLRTWLREHT